MMTTSIEELSLSAWPALQTVFYDGWILRFANGYTKRANSVNPIYASTIDVDEKIHYCENNYQDKKLPVVFKMTPTVYPNDLDDKLSAKDYRKDSPTSVQVMDLESVSPEVGQETKLNKAMSDEWLDNFAV